MEYSKEMRDAADKLAEEFGLVLLAKGDKAGWSTMDEFGHWLREGNKPVDPAENAGAWWGKGHAKE